MVPVIERVENLLAARLAEVNGTGLYLNDLGDRISRWQPTADEDLDARPCSHLVAAGDNREPSAETEGRTARRVAEWDVLGAADAIEDAPGQAAKRLGADLEATLEREVDPCLYDPELGRTLLREPLVITSVVYDVRREGSRIELVVIRVRAVWEHVVGKPAEVLQ